MEFIFHIWEESVSYLFYYILYYTCQKKIKKRPKYCVKRHRSFYYIKIRAEITICDLFHSFTKHKQHKQNGNQNKSRQHLLCDSSMKETGGVEAMNSFILISLTLQSDGITI